MKKQITIILIALSLAFTSCKKDNTDKDKIKCETDMNDFNSYITNNTFGFEINLEDGTIMYNKYQFKDDSVFLQDLYKGTYQISDCGTRLTTSTNNYALYITIDGKDSNKFYFTGTINGINNITGTATKQ